MSIPSKNSPNDPYYGPVPPRIELRERKNGFSVFGFWLVLLFSLSIMADKVLPNLITSTGASFGRFLIPAILFFLITSRLRPAFGIQWLLLWLLIGLISYIFQIILPSNNNINTSRANILLTSLATSFIIYQAIFQFVIQKKQLLQILLVYIFSVILAYVYLSLSGNLAFLEHRLTVAEGTNPNALGREIGLALIFAIILFLQGRRWILILIPILLWMLIQTGSRGALFSLAPALIIPILLKAKSLRRQIIYLGLLIIFLFIFDILLDSSDQSTIDRYTNISFESRYSIANATLALISDHPFGVGFGQVEYALYEDYGYLIPYHLYIRFYDRIDTHNAYLYVLGDLSLFGIIPFLLAHGAILRAGLKTRKKDSQLGDAAIMIVVFILVSGLSGSVLTLKYWWFGLGIASAIAALSVVSEKPDRSSVES